MLTVSSRGFIVDLAHHITSRCPSGVGVDPMVLIHPVRDSWGLCVDVCLLDRTQRLSIVQSPEPERRTLPA